MKDSGSTFLVELSFMNLVGFRASNDATSLILVLRELPLIKVVQEGFGPWSDYHHDYMGGRRWLGARAPDDIRIVFDIRGCDRRRTGISALILPYHGWLEKPFNEGVRRDGVAFSAHSSKDVHCLITVSNHMVKFKPLNPR